jgi:hypothetical protein
MQQQLDSELDSSLSQAKNLSPIATCYIGIKMGFTQAWYCEIVRNLNNTVTSIFDTSTR